MRNLMNSSRRVMVMTVASGLLAMTSSGNAAAQAAVPKASTQDISKSGRTVIEGPLSLLIEDDFAVGHARKRGFVDDARTKIRHELQFTSKQAEHLKTGMRVRVSSGVVGEAGMRVRVSTGIAGETAAADSVDATVEILDAAPASTVPASALKVLILLVDIKDSNNVVHAIDATCDNANNRAAADAFGFGTTAANVDGVYQDGSFAKLGFGGKTYPGTSLDVKRVTITDEVTACNWQAWGSKADTAAGQTGYTHRVYVVPGDVNCGWAGIAWVGAPGAWVKAYGWQPCGYIDAVAHEVGHNLGMWHSSTDFDNNATLDCEYCDDSDFMGYAEGTLRPLNAPHKVQMGYVTGAGIVDATGGGQFTLAPLGMPAAPLPQVARIFPSSGDAYYVSYRVPSGYDGYVPGVLNKISIHRYSGSGNSRLVASLGDGQSLTDAANNLTITLNSQTGSSATLTVSTGILPPTNLTAAPGNAQVALSWTARSGATGYNVKRSSTSGGPYSTLAPGVTGTTYLDTAVTNGTTYFYVVSSVNGANESSNSSPVSAKPDGVDLAVTALGNPPVSLASGASFTATDTTKNNGLISTGVSTTRYYLSADVVKDGGDLLLGGSRSVASLAAGATSSGNATVTLPAGAIAGTPYYLIACADDLNAVNETDESNNCRVSATTLQVVRADLTVTLVGIPTVPVSAGGLFKVTDTVKNVGAVAAGAFAVRYYLSTDPAKDGGDTLLGGTRSVSSLSAGQTSSGNFSVTVPSATASGTYYVLSCADDFNAVQETNEANNCLSSLATLRVARPDLAVTVVGIPTVPAAAGGKVSVTDTVKNQGVTAAGAFTTRYYLSTDSVAGGDLLLDGIDTVSSLSAGQTANDSASVTIPATVPAGAYFVIACTDDLNAVSETDETNNCRASATVLQVTLSDLVITAVTNPPTTAAVGGTFRVTDTVKNQGTVAAGASTVRYYLSLDAQMGGGDVLLTGSRAVSSMTAGKTSSSSATVIIPAGTAAGSYYLLSCADGSAAVPELDETNNCRASTGVVAVP